MDKAREQHPLPFGPDRCRMQTAAQYSPEQLIEAGRRAEAQGQVAYALQFYRFLAEQFPQSQEGAEARDALYRLSAPAAEPPRPPATLPVQQRGTRGGPAAGPALGSLSAGEPTTARPDLRAGRPEPSLTSDHGEVPPSRARRAQVEFDEPAAVLPPKVYRVGRFVAAMLNAIGWLTLLGFLVLVPTVLAALTVRGFPRPLKELIAGNVLVFGGAAFGMLVLGLFAVFAAQVARATFDTAEGVCWLLRSERQDD